MENSYMAHGNSVSNKMKINLYVFGVLMLHQVRWHVYGLDIVKINNDNFNFEEENVVHEEGYGANKFQQMWWQHHDI